MFGLLRWLFDARREPGLLYREGEHMKRVRDEQITDS